MNTADTTMQLMRDTVPKSISTHLPTQWPARWAIACGFVTTIALVDLLRSAYLTTAAGRDFDWLAWAKFAIPAYLIWFALALLVGLLLKRFPLNQKQNYGVHAGFALAFAAAHAVFLAVLWITVRNAQDFAYLVVEQFLAQWPTELMGYAVIAMIWSIGQRQKKPAPSALEFNTQPFPTRLNAEEIDYIESCDNYVIVHASGQRHIARDTMADVETRLPEDFLRTHRSIIVNLDKLRTLKSNQALLSNGTKVPISRRRKRQVAERFRKWVAE
ncbi:MAG: hypothetical protein DHS20C11_26270 [Lysobacteraceae bacterium]|nr:MAG: hypothetical protein DHS20C11_26270 [Xanthomonadaceae bacterium]